MQTFNVLNPDGYMQIYGQKKKKKVLLPILINMLKTSKNLGSFLKMNVGLLFCSFNINSQNRVCVDKCLTFERQRIKP